MCYQVVELYSGCRCLYYQHAVERCPRYGARGHGITQRTILVQHFCIDHSSSNNTSNDNSNALRRDALKSGQARSGPRGARDHAALGQTPQGGSAAVPAKAHHSQVRKNIPGDESHNSPWMLAQKQAALQILEAGITPEKPEYEETNMQIPNDPKPHPLVEKAAKAVYSSLSPPTRSREDHAKPKSEEDRAIGAVERILEKYMGPSHIDKRSGSWGIHSKHHDGSQGDVDPEDSLSDTSTVSEAITVISAELPSLTDDSVLFGDGNVLTGDGGVLTGAISRRLLLCKDLRYLWPQLVLQCGSKRECVAIIGELLGRYSEDLSKLSFFTNYLNDNDRSRDRAAYKFIDVSRFCIAETIWMAHCDGETDRIKNKEGTFELLDDMDAKEAIPNKEIHHFLDECEAFLYKSEPIVTLQSRAMALERSQHQAFNGFGSTLYGLAESSFLNGMSAIYERPLRPGTHRVRWRCVSP